MQSGKKEKVRKEKKGEGVLFNIKEKKPMKTFIELQINIFITRFFLVALKMCEIFDIIKCI